MSNVPRSSCLFATVPELVEQGRKREVALVAMAGPRLQRGGRAARDAVVQAERGVRVGDLVHLGGPAPGAAGGAGDAPPVDPFPCELVLEAVGARDRVRLRLEQDADLVPANAIFSADAAPIPPGSGSAITLPPVKSAAASSTASCGPER
jgi:hypothetical protein